MGLKQHPNCLSGWIDWSFYLKLSVIGMINELKEVLVTPAAIFWQFATIKTVSVLILMSSDSIGLCTPATYLLAYSRDFFQSSNNNNQPCQVLGYCRFHIRLDRNNNLASNVTKNELFVLLFLWPSPGETILVWNSRHMERWTFAFMDRFQKIFFLLKARTKGVTWQNIHPWAFSLGTAQ